MGKEGQNAQTSNYKIKLKGDIIYSMMTIVNTILHI